MFSLQNDDEPSDPDFEDGSQVQRMGPWIITCQVTVKPRITSFYMVFLWFSKDSWAESESPSAPRSEPIHYIPTRIRKNIWKNHMPAVTTLSIAIDPKLLQGVQMGAEGKVTPMTWDDLGPTTSTWVKKTSDRWNIPYYVYIYIHIMCNYIYNGMNYGLLGYTWITNHGSDSWDAHPSMRAAQYGTLNTVSSYRMAPPSDTQKHRIWSILCLTIWQRLKFMLSSRNMFETSSKHVCLYIYICSCLNIYT